MSKWINFVIIKEGNKTNIWRLITKKGFGILGIIKWCPTWRGYAFYPEINTLYEQDCLRDIASFIEEKNREHRAIIK